MKTAFLLMLFALALPGLSQHPDPSAASADSSTTGTTVVLRLRGNNGPDGQALPVTSAALDRAMEAYRQRLKGQGVKGFSVVKEADDCLRIDLPPTAADKLRALQAMLVKQGKLEFRMAMRDSENWLKDIEAKTKFLDPAYEVLPQIHQTIGGKKEEQKLIVKKEIAIGGDQVEMVNAVPQPDWSVWIKFRPEGGKKFGEITAAMEPHVDRFAIVLDGVVISAPVLNQPGGIHGGSCTISGRFSEAEARELATNLNSPLENPVSIISVKPTPPANKTPK